MKSQKLKISWIEDTILMHTVSKGKPLIRYIMGDMISPSYGSSLFQNASLNRTPGENIYNLGYLGPNGIPKDVIEKSRNLVSMV